MDGAAAERGASADGGAGAEGGADADAGAGAAAGDPGTAAGGAAAAAGGAAAERPDRRVRRVRLSDVAERANVSTSTASRALNGIGELSDDTRAAVIRAAEELDFRPSPAARSLRTRRSHTVGLVVPTVAHAFYAAVTTGAQAALQQSGYRLILVDSGEDPQSVTEAVRTLLDHEVDGLLVSTAPFGAEQFNELLGTTPCVFIDELAPGAGAGNVVLENGRGIELLVDHVVEHGHTRIAYLGGPKDRTSGYERQAAFIQAMERHGLPVTDELITQCEWTITSGFEGAAQILAAEPQPTALVTASGELGLGALAAARRARRAIPDDLALVVFDDLYFAPLLEPSLTGIAYDARAIGHEGARLLLGVVGNEGNTEREVRIDVSLVRRRSCGCDYDPGTELAEAVA
ncbi:MAG: LacI family DNA-binding transcriptional regulator [Solirubrobacteraceae bacterium]